MHGATRTVLCLLGPALGLACLGASTAWSAGLDCTARWLSTTELTVCEDPQLARMDEELERRIDGLAQRLNLGQYLGLRHWQAARAKQRNACARDRECIGASFKAQGRFLDRLQRCVSTSLARRSCLRDLVAGDREAQRK
jgi:uncharacterized protein